MNELLLGAIVGIVLTEIITFLLEFFREKICCKISCFKKYPKLYSPIMSCLLACVLLIPMLQLSELATIRAIDSDLMMAQTYYDAGDYLSAMDLYRLHANESGVAAYNLAHMYAMGEGVVQDKDYAEQYYRIAQSKGVSEAIRGVVYLHIRYPKSYSDILDAITWGYSLNDTETRIFVERIMRFELDMSGEWDVFLASNSELSKEKRDVKLCEMFFAHTDDEQILFLKNNTYLIQTSYKTFRNECPTDTLYEKYIYDSTEIVEKEHKLGKDILITYLVEYYGLYAGTLFEQGGIIYI